MEKIMTSKYIVMLLSTIFGLLLVAFQCNGQFTTCNYYQTMTIGKTYYVFSPGYPALYKPGTNCRWQATAPYGYRINLNCGVVQLPPDILGNLDRIEVSYTGYANLSNALIYTTNSSFAYSSYGNTITVALRSSIYSSGGKFLCSLITSGGTIVPIQPPTIPPINPIYCNCGQQNNPNNGGYQSTAGLIQLAYGTLFCGATIISHYYAITAAYCTQNRIAQNIGLIVGLSTYQPSGSNIASGNILRIQQIITNSGYVATTYTNDIALVQTQTPIPYNGISIGPACLPFRFAQQNNAFGNYFVETVGWKPSYGFYGGPIQTLQSVQLTVIPNAQCLQYLPVVASQICLYTPYNNTCQMSLGSPTYYIQNGYQYLIGVGSFVQGCSTKNYPGVDARVTSFVNWIVQNTPGSSYCYN